MDGFQWPVNEWGTQVRIRSTLYNTFRPLAWVCFLSGQLPLENLHQNKAVFLRFSWTSPAFAYTILLNTTLVLLHVVTCQFISHNFFRWNNTVFGIRCYISYFYLLGCSSELVKLIKILEEFDVKLVHLPVLVRSSRQPRRHIGWLICAIVTLVIPIVMAVSIWVVTSNIPVNEHISNVIGFLLYFSRLLQVLLYLFFCSEICIRFQQLHRSWMKYLEFVCRFNFDSSALNTDKYRLLNKSLIDCIGLMSNAFGLTLASVCLFAFLEIVLVILLSYCFNTIPKAHIPMAVILWFYPTYISGAWSHKLVDKSREMNHQVFELRLCGLNDDLRNDIDMLAHQLQVNREGFQASGFFNYNRAFVGSFISLVVTYFIVATQFGPQVKRMVADYN